MSWEVESETRAPLGYFRIFFTAPGGAKTDVTFFREIPTSLGNFSQADPFGYAAATISFSQISLLDNLGHGDLSWLSHFSDVDIVLQRPDGSQEIVWEGFVASYDWTTQLVVQCQGALFQVDKYVSFPQYPSVPIAYEQLIAEMLSPSRHPHLRTEELRIEWPDNWDVLAFRDPLGDTAATVIDPFTGAASPLDPTGVRTTYTTVGVQAGGRTTGFSTRTTGAWDKALTGYIAGLLEVMYTTEYADQWSIRCDPGRIPVMFVRAAAKPADYTLDVGQPGIESLSLSKDYTQFANVIFGSGTTPEGSAYSRQSVSRDNTRTEYLPFAADRKVWPDNAGNPGYDPSIMRVETHVGFENGMYESDALRVAKLMLQRNSDPGYAGSIGLSVDPAEGSRYLIKAGSVLKLRYLDGTGEAGVNFHVAEVNVNVETGTVELKLDSKFRSLLTIEEVLARTRDPLTPIKMLQVGKESQIVPDKAAPWSYAQGSGYIPITSKPFYDQVLLNEFYPLDLQAQRLPPRLYPAFYVALDASAATRRGRWATAAIRTAEKGNIRLTQFACYDRDGNRLAIPFHVSLYYHQVTSDNMPYDGDGPSPFVPGAWQKVNAYGQPIGADSPGATALGDDSLIVGWGDSDQPAGYSPGSKAAGSPITGLLTDETGWDFDNTSNPDFEKNPAAGYTQLESAITVYAMFYAEYSDWVYITGRIYRQEPGTT